MLQRIRLDEDAPTSGYPWDLPAVRDIARLAPHPAVTFLVGGNGTGKSTIIEAIAVGSGFNAEGGSRHVRFETRRTDSRLHEHLTLSWHPRPRFGWFLRAESFYNVASYIDDNVAEYFDRSFHEESHGESFIDLAMQRFRPGGFYLLDEPEAALSFHGCLRLLRVVHDAVRGGAQFMIATHSPVVLAYPTATIFELSDSGIRRVGYDELEVVQLWRDFLGSPDLFLRHLLSDDDVAEPPLPASSP